MGRSLTPPIGFESGLAGVNIHFSSLMREREERNPQVVTEHCPGGIEKLKAKKKGTHIQEGSQTRLDTC